MTFGLFRLLSYGVTGYPSSFLLVVRVEKDYRKVKKVKNRPQKGEVERVMRGFDRGPLEE